MSFVYAVRRDKIREFALAVGETNALHFDPAAARAAGYADVVAPPMFVAVFAAPAFRDALWSLRPAADRRLTLHAAQEFRWKALVVAGDEITTSVLLAGDHTRGAHRTLTFETSSARGGELIVDGTWAVVVRARG
jgi:acyl dehydratase